MAAVTLAERNYCERIPADILRGTWAYYNTGVEIMPGKKVPISVGHGQQTPSVCPTDQYVYAYDGDTGCVRIAFLDGAPSVDGVKRVLLKVVKDFISVDSEDAPLYKHAKEHWAWVDKETGSRMPITLPIWTTRQSHDQ
jgi:hypothetical protein